MSLLNGLLIGQMIWSATRGAQKPPAFTLVHSLPGRLRVCVAEIKGDSGASERLQGELLAIDGVREANAEPRTGSVLLRYDDSPETRQAIVQALEGADGDSDDTAAKESTEQGPPKLLTSVVAAARRANRQVLERSHGLVDLETLVAMGFGAWGLKTLVLPAGRSRLNGVSMIYWSYNMLRRQAAA